jgi:DNA ligase-1
VEERLLPLREMNEAQQRAMMLQAWSELDSRERFVWHKLITGAFRVGVSQQLVTRALSMVSGVDAAVVAHRLMGAWEPSAAFYARLLSPDTHDADVSQPYPFCLAHPVDDPSAALGDAREWLAEWKWDGIRAQLIHRAGQVFLWSRGEELVTERYPELAELGALLPDGTVIDGEILPWKDGAVLPFALLQRRIGRKTLSKKLLSEIPVVLLTYDLLELDGQDVRNQPLEWRRARLEELAAQINDDRRPTTDEGRRTEDEGRPTDHGQPTTDNRPRTIDHRQPTTDNRPWTTDHEPRTTDNKPFRLSPIAEGDTWESLAQARERSREINAEGLMLKRRSSPYRVGRQRGEWWKWKIAPYTIDAVLIYAQRGSGKRASLYTDYTFAVWDNGQLVPFAKAYSGLTDAEIRQVDAFIRRNTVEKFGPVRTVKPELVFELAFEGIQRSNRHKSGIAVRFPRILRRRTDKTIEEADSLETIKGMLPGE